MGKLNLNKATLWTGAEALVWVMFIVTSAAGGLHMLGMISLDSLAQEWVGRALLAFGLLTLLFVAFKGASKTVNQ